MRVYPSTSEVIRAAVSAVAATAVVFAMLGSSASAAAPVVRDHVANSTAGATNTVCEGTICTSTSVYIVVNDPTGPTEVCLYTSRYDKTDMGPFPLAYETGCIPLAEGAFSIDNKGLSSATLSTVAIALESFTCNSSGCQSSGTRTAEVRATYTGVGDILTFRSNGKSTFGACSMYYGGKGSQRDATAVLTINGRSIDAAGYLAMSTQRIKVLCH